MIQANLPALQVVVPLLSAPLCVLLRRERVSYAITFVVSWLALAMAIALLQQVLAAGPISYELGGWAPPWGIEYKIDAVNAYVLLIVAAIGAAVITYAGPSVAREIEAERRYLFYTSYLLCLAGLLGVTITGDAFNVFVFLEISSLSSYILISLGKDRRALTAAYRYLIFGTIGATFYLIGVGLLYQVTGTLNIADLAARVEPLTASRTVRAAFASLPSASRWKAALFPLHIWLPNAYAYAPSVVSAFLAATATKVSVYLLIRVFLTIFGASFAFDEMNLGLVLLPFAIAAMFVGSLVAIFQPDIQAHARLFEHRADWLHSPRHQHRHGARGGGRHAPPVQPRADEGDAVHGDGPACSTASARCDWRRWPGSASACPGPWPHSLPAA